MIAKKELKTRLGRIVFGCFFVIMGILGMFSGVVVSGQEVYAIPEETVVVDDATNNETQATEENLDTEDEVTGEVARNTSGGDSCKDSLGAIGWLVCPTTGKIAEAVDWLYDKIEEILVINPISMEDGSPIYEIWKYCRGITNIVFIIFLLVVIYSQLTGLGISNYGLKKVLPKLIVTAVLVNLSFLICSLAVDASNIVGNGLRGIFTGVEESVMANGVSPEIEISYSSMYSSLAGGTALAVGAGVVAFEFGEIWMLIPVVLGAIVAVVSGLITIALRQAVVVLLIMISPLAMVANILPNVEQWFKKWKDLLIKMLVFYPMFSLLFGASSLAGFAIILSAKSGFGILLGVAVQIFPLFFSWSLMKMSGTFLGDINAKMRAIADRPLAANRAWAESRKAQTSAYYKQYGMTPFSHLRRYVDNRKALREQNTDKLQGMRKNDANIYAQKKFSGGYDGSQAQNISGYLKPNKYVRAAKDFANSNLASETATMDTAHVINNYGSYFVDRATRERVKVAKKAKDEGALRAIEAANADYRRDAIGGRNYLEHSRAQMTAENDDEADFKFMVNEYLDAILGYDPNKASEGFSKYRHYILSSAGGLGEIGQTRVLGKILARSASVESNQRRDINIIANKFPPDKRNFRNFLFNYYIDDDGYATDKDGNRIENMRDYLRVNDPEKLVMWDQVDENGPYFDWYDVNGNYVTRIYKKDKSAIKELMSNFDAPINDPINNMLAIHAGIKEDSKNPIPVLRNMGLDAYRTTIGRALLSAPFKEKNAAFSPMVAEMVKKGYIKNYAQEYLAYLDSLNKATKPGAFNVQDGDAIDMFTMMMDPDRWEEVFPTDLIRGYKNVNGEPIYGIRIDENGNRVKVAAEEATREELMRRITEKYIIPAGKKITVMMSRQTQNTIDNQKAGTAEKWKKLKEIFDTKWGEGRVLEADPYQQEGDMGGISRDIRGSLYTIDSEGNRHPFGPNRRNNSNRHGGRNSQHVNHAAQIYEIFNSSLNADDFAVAVSEYCSRYHELAWMTSQIQDFIVSEGYGVTKEQIYDFVEELLSYVDND